MCGGHLHELEKLAQNIPNEEQLTTTQMEAPRTEAPHAGGPALEVAPHSILCVRVVCLYVGL